jgi:Tfp pilus assembly protein PilF
VRPAAVLPALGLALGLGLAPCPLRASNAGVAQAHADLSDRLAKAGRLQDACAELDAALQADPGRPDWAQRLASLRGSAHPGASNAPTAAPLSGSAAVNVADCLAQAREAYRQSDLAGAELAWRQALSLKPGLAEAEEGLARLQREAYHHDPDQPFDQSVGDLYDAALREMRKGRLVEARQKLENARALNPVQAQVLQAMGWIQGQASVQQQSRDAQSLLAEGQRRLADGSDAKAAAAFSAALQAQPDLAEARKGLEEIRKRNSDKVQAALAQGRAAVAKKDWAAADKAYSLALSLAPEDADAKAGQSQASAELENARQAAARRKAADLSYNNGVEAWQAGDLGAAAVDFRETLRADPQDQEAAKALASVQAKLEASVDQDRAKARGLLAEGRRLETEGALEEALKRYQRAAAADPGLTPAAQALDSLQKRMKGL